MNVVRKALLCAVSTLFFCKIAGADVPICKQGSTDQLDQVKTKIYFVNGINTLTWQQAKKNLEEIRRNLKQELSAQQFNTLGFDVAFNPSAKQWLDVLESIKQKVGDENAETRFWRWITNLDPMPDWLQALAQKKLVDATTALAAVTPDVQDHVALYEADLISGKSVIVFAHSQGNFFANEAYNEIFVTNPQFRNLKSSFGVIAVATPASYTAGETDDMHVTRGDDLIINEVRVLAAATSTIPQPLFANVDHPSETSDSNHHAFVEAYMTPEDAESRQMILDRFAAEFSAIVQPTAIAQTGIITATLTWGSQPDVDLHTYEPGPTGINGTHVYYAQKEGESGFLDVDDTDGFGPEHYTVPTCATLQAGTYIFGVNYYDGLAPEDAILHIQAGLETQSFPIHLDHSVGGLGDNNPFLLGMVEVSGNLTDGYTFSIRPAEIISPAP